MSSKSVFLLAALALATLGGCGDDLPPRVKVSGTVLIDGKPLTRGIVRVVPSGARPSHGEIGPDGRFTLGCFEMDDGCVPGTHRVTVTADEFVSPDGVKWHAPKRYASLSTSGLTATITAPTDSLVINITWGRGQPFIEKIEPIEPDTP